MAQINLTLNDKNIVLLGTAHVSRESCEEVRAAIIEKKPDCVAIELDEQRYASLNDRDGWKNLDIIKVLKEKKGFLLLANLVMANFQRKMGANVGVKPGDEMRAGIETAKSLGIPCEMVDRPIQTTLRRAWGMNSGVGKIKLLSALIASAFDKEEVGEKEIENLKEKSEMDGMLSELSEYMPAVKKVLIDERDFYLAAHIWKAVQKDSRKSVVAVLGAGHLPGVQKNLEEIVAGKKSCDTEEISRLPEKKSRLENCRLVDSSPDSRFDCGGLCLRRNDERLESRRLVGFLECGACRSGRAFGRRPSAYNFGFRGWRAVHESLPVCRSRNVRRNCSGGCLQAESQGFGECAERHKRKRILQKPALARSSRVFPKLSWLERRNFYRRKHNRCQRRVFLQESFCEINDKIKAD